SRPATGRSGFRTSRKSTSSASSSRTASTSTRNRARWRWSRRTTSTTPRASAPRTRYERSGAWTDDARPDRRGDHDGLPDGLHDDGPWHAVRLPRVPRSVAERLREQGVRPVRAAHLWRDEQRNAAVDP